MRQWITGLKSKTCIHIFFTMVGLATLFASVCGCGVKQWDTQPYVNASKTYDVKILRDSWGVPHVMGKTDADAAFGLAYAHAEDDFQTIQEMLLVMRGQLASLKGKDAAPLDYLIQALRVRERVWDRYEKDLTAETRAVVEAYAAGTNYYAALHPDEVVADLFPVDGRDVVAGFAAMVPLFYGMGLAIEDLFGPERPLEVSDKEAVTSNLPGQGLPNGSNAFAVSPLRSSDGQTMLCSNSHQPWTGPVAWYEAHVKSEEGWDMTGALFPGSPVVLVGHNRHLGWTSTVNRPDLFDIYVLEENPDDKDQYRLDDKWLNYEKTEASLRVRLPGGLKITVKRDILWSVHGPVFKADHGTYAIRYAGMDEIRMVEQWYRMNKAEDHAQWLDAMEMIAVPSFNMIYADKEGNIHYIYNGLFPIREPGYDWTEYLPGDTSETIWQEFYPLSRVPQVLNPASGFVQSCNSSPFQTTTGDDNPNPDDFPVEMGIRSYMTNRAYRALALYGDDESITWDEFIAYKWDEAYAPESEVAQVIKGLIDGPLPEDPLAREAIEVLRRWDGNADFEDRSMALVAGVGGPTMMARLSSRPIPDPLKLLIEAARKLKKAHGRIDPPWGEVARLARGEVDLPLSGGPDTLRAIFGEKIEHGRLVVDWGDSFIQFVRWDKDGGVSSWSIHQFGAATMDEDSPHYADQAPLFAAKQLKPVWYDEADTRANLTREYRPGEELLLSE